MDLKASSILLSALVCLLASTSTAFNITKILSSYPEFASFNELLTQTGLAQQINSRQTITVLAVADSNLDTVSGKDLDVVKRILSVHVILDYYDGIKLSKMQEKSRILTTLYQTTGIADDKQGFVNVSRTPEGIMFGSAMKGSQLSAQLVGQVVAQPYNISVLEVSEIIETPGIERMAPPPPPGAAAPPKKAVAPPPTKALAPAEKPTTPPGGNAPTLSPAEGLAPDASPPAADGPVADAPVADEAHAPAPKKSGSSRMEIGVLAIVMGLMACVMGL